MHIFRNVKRVVYQVDKITAISLADLYTTNLILSFEELEEFNAHLRNYLTEEEIGAKVVSWQNYPLETLTKQELLKNAEESN